MNEQGVEEVYSKYLNSDDMILLVKDKFSNWSELLLDIFDKKLESKEYLADPLRENSFIVFRDDNLSEKDRETYF